jgi:hypothetical protein
MLTVLSSGQIGVLLVDDGPNPAASEVAAEYARFAGFTFLRNGANRGYARTFCRSIESCETEYLMALSDDDLLEIESIGHIEDVLLRKTPAFASPMYRLGSAIYHGLSKTQAIAASEYINCSGHAPGLIYRISKVRPVPPLLLGRLDEAKADALC